jgi:hypothetical protein
MMPFFILYAVDCPYYLPALPVFLAIRPPVEVE